MAQVTLLHGLRAPWAEPEIRTSWTLPASCRAQASSQYVCVYIHTCTYICIYTYKYVCLSVRLSVCMCGCKHVCVCVCIRVCVYVEVHLHVYTHIHICTCVCVYTCLDMMHTFSKTNRSLKFWTMQSKARRDYLEWLAVCTTKATWACGYLGSTHSLHCGQYISSFGKSVF